MDGIARGPTPLGDIIFLIYLQKYQKTYNIVRDQLGEWKNLVETPITPLIPILRNPR